MTETIQKKIPSIFELPITDRFSTSFPMESLIDDIEKKETKVQIMKGVWSLKEDEALTEAVKQASDPICWDWVSKKVKGRTSKQCRERWLFRLSPDVKKSPFQQWEDELIVLKRQMIGNHWSAIAQMLPGRTSCAVKNRWYTVLRNRVQYQNTEPMKNISPQIPPQIPQQVYANKGYYMFE